MIPDDRESCRLHELFKYQILDTPDEEAYDSITSLLVEICDVPIALVSLVDAKRQWFKSKVGLDVNETPREISFCRHVVESENPLVVTDATLDDRFANSPLVTGPPYIRFYAGMPLVTSSGYVLGSLCVIDRKPRTLTAGQLKALTVLGKHVITQLELRYQLEVADAANKQIEEQRQLLEQQAEELLRARDLAIESTKTKANFLAVMSHEIRTPLNAVIGLTELLLAESLEPKVYDFIQRISKSGEALLDVVNDILDLSKIESGRMLVDSHEFNLEQLILGAVDVVRPRAEGKHIGLEILLAPNAAEGMCGDSHKIRQILLNLLSNAVKFTSSGAVRVEQTFVSDCPLGTMTRIAVSDSGIGIAPERLDSVFERFTQADEGITRKYGGTGLGLAICKQLAELLGGRIGVSSILGSGSTFWIEVPLQRSAPIENGNIPVATPEEDLSNVPALRILLVEDDATNRMVAEGFLQQWKCQFISVGDGYEALDMFSRESFDLILMDVRMPELDGYKVTEEIRRQEGDSGKHIPIIAMTGNALEGDRELCLRAGMDDYISKPLRGAALRTMLSRWDRQARRSD